LGQTFAPRLAHFGNPSVYVRDKHGVVSFCFISINFVSFYFIPFRSISICFGKCQSEKDALSLPS